MSVHSVQDSVLESWATLLQSSLPTSLTVFVGLGYKKLQQMHNQKKCSDQHSHGEMLSWTN
jgi:hypothetical protein